MNKHIPNFYMNRILREPYFHMNTNHFHSEYELYYLLSGTRKLFINNNFYTLKSHDLIIIGKGDLHRTSYITNTPHERVVIYFNDQWLAPYYQTYGIDLINQCLLTHKRSLTDENQQYFIHLLTKIEQEQINPDAFSTNLIKAYFEELLIFLLRNQDTDNSPSDDSNADIVKAARYICSNYETDLTLEQVASYVNLSPTYFSKKFKTSTGFGFKEYLIHIRTKEAAKQLLETNDSITTIAIRCGFNDSNYFGDLFKKITNFSPRMYRKTKGMYPTNIENSKNIPPITNPIQEVYESPSDSKRGG